LINYDFCKIKSISKINKSIPKTEIKISDTWRPLDVPRGMLTSALNRSTVHGQTSPRVSLCQM